MVGTLCVPVNSLPTITKWTGEDAMLHPACPYVLLSVGEATQDKGAEFVIPRYSCGAFCSFPGGVRLPLQNKGGVICMRPFGYKLTPSMAVHVKRGGPLPLPDVKQVVLILGAGRPRGGRIHQWLTAQGRSAFPVGIRYYGKHHNLASPAVVQQIVQYIQSRGMGSVDLAISMDCATWSSAHVRACADGSPGGLLRTVQHPMGVPGLEGRTLRRRIS